MKSFDEKYRQFKTIIDRRLTSCVKKSKPVTLYEPMKYVLSGGGKRVRPLLTMLSCESVGGTAAQALSAAAALEILHNFTLVHDDIMDHAPSRRGRATVHTKWDENIAILVGDALVASAYRELLKTKSNAITHVTDVFTEGVLEVCEGQTYDKEYELEHDVSLDDYLLMISKKTGKLFAVASEMGALIGNGTDREVRALRSYGTFIGRAFQIQDDLLDIVADESEFGKAIGGDIVEGKKTYLLIQAANNASGKDKKLIQSIFRNGGTHRKNIPAVRDIYERYGILELAKQAIVRDIHVANLQLKKLRESSARDMLYWFSDMVLKRKF